MTRFNNMRERFGRNAKSQQPESDHPSSLLEDNPNPRQHSKTFRVISKLGQIFRRAPKSSKIAAVQEQPEVCSNTNTSDLLNVHVNVAVNEGEELLSSTVTENEPAPDPLNAQCHEPAFPGQDVCSLVVKETCREHQLDGPALATADSTSHEIEITVSSKMNVREVSTNEEEGASSASAPSTSSQREGETEKVEPEAMSVDRVGKPQQIGNHSLDDDEAGDTTATSSNSEDSEAGLERQDWATVESIPDLKLQQLLQSTLNPTGRNKLTTEDCQVVQRFNGGFNHIVRMTATGNSRLNHYIIRVPAIGTLARWQGGDAHNMRYEMALVEYILQNTSIPVPEVIAFDDTLDSCISAPYCIMEALPGKAAHAIWFEDLQNRDHITANAISAETESKRCNFLRSLARTMAGLQALEFDKIGAPDLGEDEESTITHSYRWKSPHQMSEEDLRDEGQIYQYGPFDSSLQYMTSQLDEMVPNTPDPDLEDDPKTRDIIYGARKILDTIYAHPAIAFSKHDPTNTAEKESFVLRHPDLDMQNILVDNVGNVTGILDWENCLAVPRCVGYASVPDFLRRDWSQNYSLATVPHMTWQLDHYRRVYADAMLATGAPDAKYTAKSAMYRAIVDSVTEGSPMDLIEKLCAHIPGLRLTDIEELEELIGKGWPQAEEYLKTEMEKLLAPDSDVA